MVDVVGGIVGVNIICTADTMLDAAVRIAMRSALLEEHH